jgi:tetratricopeptide (TPR) repeat protein
MSEQNIFNRYADKIRNFYSGNKKIVNIVGGSVILVIGLIAFWTLYWHPKREHAAAAKLAKIQHYFDTDSLNIVLNGIKGKKLTTAPEIADSYGFTKKGKEAALMAGVAYLQTGKYEKALKYLDKADANDLLLGPSIAAAKAGCYAELGKIEKAAETYEKAADWGNNEFTALFLKKAGIQFELAKDYKSAIRCWEKLRSHYSKTPEASDVEKYIYRAKAYLGELNN